MHTIARWATVFAVGDSRQNLYKWRGVDPEDFINQPWPKIALTESFRVPPDGIRACNLIAAAAGDPSPPLQVMNQDSSTIRVVNSTVVETVKRLVRELYSPSEIAVLCRYNTQVAEFGAQIQEAGLDISVATLPPGGPVQLFLNYLAAPDSGTLRMNCSDAWRPYLSLGVPKIIEHICSPIMSLDTCSALTKSWLSQLGVVVGPAQVLSKILLPHALQPDARYYMTEYHSCTLEQFSKDTSGIYGQELDKQKGVAVLTVHQAKGLEWPCVIIPECNNGVLPRDPDKINNEDRRVFLVAITRYKEQLYILLDPRREPSVFLAESGIFL